MALFALLPSTADALHSSDMSATTIGHQELAQPRARPDGIVGSELSSGVVGR